MVVVLTLLWTEESVVESGLQDRWVGLVDTVVISVDC